MNKPSWYEIKGSSNIAAMAYTSGDPETNLGTLWIRFSSGTEYEYPNVPAQLAEDFFEADSLGKFFHANIRVNYKGAKFFSNEQQDELEDKLQEGDGEPAEMLVSDEELAEVEEDMTIEELFADDDGMAPKEPAGQTSVVNAEVVEYESVKIALP